MKKIFTLLMLFFAVTVAMAQAPTGVFAKASVAPKVDGVIDAVWSEATAYNITRAVGTQTPTIGAPGETTWKGLWTKEGVYILLEVNDNAFYPNYVAGTGLNDYDYDKLELYFDVNYVLQDGKGPSAGNSGHIQIAPGYKLDKNDGTPFTNGGVINAFMVNGSHYIAEYFVPFTKLIDKDGIQVDKTNTIGFDVTVIDRDPGDASRNQAVWSNQGAAGESWANMDDAGLVTFDGAESNTLVESLVIGPKNGTITTDKGTLQLTTTITPEDATVKIVKWVIDGGTAQCTISPSGLLTAISNGTVSIKAVTTDGSFTESDLITITITGQKKIKYSDEVWNTDNLIKNWNFDTDVTDWGGWVDPAVTGQLAPAVENGVCVMKVGLSGDSWHYQHNQSPLAAEPNVEYTVKFKTWASAKAPCILDFESASSITTGNGGDQYVRYGSSTDAEANAGQSEWHYDATTIPSWFTFHVTFDKIIETTIQKIQWMNSLSNETIYLDSVLMVKTEQLIPVGTGVSTHLSNAIKVYPNPIGKDNQLTVELSAINEKVAIYNAVGQKLMEKTATGNFAKFDVSSLRKGLYFVKLGDGSIQKFVR